MAGLKKPSKKRDATNPNTVIVVFLVFFVLLSIGLGIFAYYGYAGQDKLRTTAKDEILKAAANKQGEDFRALMARDCQLAITGTLDAEELNSWKNALPEALNDGGKFKDEKARPIFKKLRDENSALLGGTDDNKGYQTSYKEKVAKLLKDLKDAQATMVTAQNEANEAKKGLAELQLKTDAYWDKAMKEIKKGNKATLDKSKEMSAMMKKQIEENEELQKQLSGIEEKFKGQIDKLTGDIRLRDVKIKEKELALKEASSQYVPRLNSEPHSLVLDVSKGKTIWDRPRGKITRVDLDNRQVVINLGSNAGVKPETTFNVFGGNPKGHAEGSLKGTVEVVRVVDGNTSLARITSLYDASGTEIALNDPAIGRVQREVSNVIKKDDLLFNLTFGAHAFIAGAVHWTGGPAVTPAGQMRNLQEFMSILENQGIKIDGYIDLADGKIIGGITPETRFIVRGHSLVVEKKAVAKKDDDEKAEDAKAPANGGREKNVNDAIIAIRNEAVEKGLFIISAENLANVIGYRRQHSANELEASAFRPTLPGAP
jgi:hypothetical protein